MQKEKVWKPQTVQSIESVKGYEFLKQRSYYKFQIVYKKRNYWVYCYVIRKSQEYRIDKVIITKIVNIKTKKIVFEKKTKQGVSPFSSNVIYEKMDEILKEHYNIE